MHLKRDKSSWILQRLIGQPNNAMYIIVTKGCDLPNTKCYQRWCLTMDWSVVISAQLFQILEQTGTLDCTFQAVVHGNCYTLQTVNAY